MFRRASLIAIAISTSFITYAQFEKGKSFTGGTIGTAFYSNDRQDVTFPSPTLGYKLRDKNFNITLMPMVGKFISSRTAVGGALNIGFNNSTSSFEGPNGNTFQKDE